MVMKGGVRINIIKKKLLDLLIEIRPVIIPFAKIMSGGR